MRFGVDWLVLKLQRHSVLHYQHDADANRGVEVCESHRCLPMLDDRRRLLRGQLQASVKL